ncbi:MAG: methylenetetrahydrofolate--tRNA-(uracil(54)-C(5))-methyltransferase (FADH(2)-oxidizing) TrmFO [Bdellovibrionaceae bacterium]|nr:methylenetetrahydrofolate--tRNA-(uracil(54)-C(5))-methyltransferase (FADH(2)-oxidizing) TrmFO [Pseudobdellovibrionaceae bacterium]
MAEPFNKTIHVVGAGLAGSECALQLAQLGHSVVLWEMRGMKSTPAHKTRDFAELVCSNSLGSLAPESAPGQLKFEAETMGCHILSIAKANAVPAGQALGVDRERFAKDVTKAVLSHPRIEVRHQIVHRLNDIPRPCVIATGPLTDDDLAEDLRKHFGEDFCYFFDAIAPIVDADSINMDIAWKADRYGKGSADYINCPLNREQYENLIEAIRTARKIEPKHFETTDYFEGCMPIEEMVERGPETLRFGPMKPVGLPDPRTGQEPWAVVQLRQDNREGTAYNMVGFQTRMAYGEQVRVFRMIPGLENAEFLKLGSIHRNLYINSPAKLNKDLSSKSDPWLFFAGQITGVEGYFESTCIGLLVAHFVHQKLMDKPFCPPPRDSAMGSLLHAITDPDRARHFQPTNINFGLFPSPDQNTKSKSKKRERQIEKAKISFSNWKSNLGIPSHQRE